MCTMVLSHILHVLYTRIYSFCYARYDNRGTTKLCLIFFLCRSVQCSGLLSGCTPLAFFFPCLLLSLARSVTEGVFISPLFPYPINRSSSTNQNLSFFSPLMRESRFNIDTTALVPNWMTSTSLWYLLDIKYTIFHIVILNLFKLTFSLETTHAWMIIVDVVSITIRDYINWFSVGMSREFMCHL